MTNKIFKKFKKNKPWPLIFCIIAMCNNPHYFGEAGKGKFKILASCTSF